MPCLLLAMLYFRQNSMLYIGGAKGPYMVRSGHFSPSLLLFSLRVTTDESLAPSLPSECPPPSLALQRLPSQFGMNIYENVSPRRHPSAPPRNRHVSLSLGPVRSHEERSCRPRSSLVSCGAATARCVGADDALLPGVLTPGADNLQRWGQNRGLAYQVWPLPAPRTRTQHSRACAHHAPVALVPQPVSNAVVRAPLQPQCRILGTHNTVFNSLRALLDACRRACSQRCRQPQSRSRPTIIMFHGNAGTIMDVRRRTP